MTPPVQDRPWGGRLRRDGSHGRDQAPARARAERPDRWTGTATRAARSSVGQDPPQPVPAPQAVRRGRAEASSPPASRPTASCSRWWSARPATTSSSSPASGGCGPPRRPGWREVPVHVVEFDDQQVFEAALVENIQRSDLNPIEKAQGFKEYLDKFGLTQDQLGAEARPRPDDDQQPARPAEPAGRGAGRGAARADHPRPRQGAQGRAGRRPAGRPVQGGDPAEPARSTPWSSSSSSSRQEPAAGRPRSRPPRSRRRPPTSPASRTSCGSGWR